MPSYRLKLRVFLLALALGLALVGFIDWLDDYSKQIKIVLPEAMSETLVVDVNPGFIGFESIGHGCGGRDRYGGSGWVTGYRWNLTKYVSHSGSGYETRANAKRVLELRRTEASEVLEDSRSHHPSRFPVRLILRHHDESGDSFEIINYEGKDYIEDITSRDLGLALYFEIWNATENN